MSAARQLGGSGVAVSRVVFGCMEFTPGDAAERIRTIHAAFDAGVTSFDTAPLYGFGAAEELLGQAIADRRGSVQILTKAGLRWDSDQGEIHFAIDGPGSRRFVRRSSRRESLREEVTRSLRRLGVETIDLLQIHQRDHETPLAETCAELAALQREGKIRAIGVSNFSASDLRQCAAALAGLSTALEALQLEYNLVDRRAEAELLPAARERQISVLAYSPLAQGLLAGRQLRGTELPGDWRRDSPYFRSANVAQVNAGIERVLLPIARARGATAAQVALAWLLGQAAVTAVVVGARDPDQAAANAGAAAIELTPDEKRSIALAFAGVELSAPAERGVRATARRVRSLLRRVARVARPIVGR